MKLPFVGMATLGLALTALSVTVSAQQSGSADDPVVATVNGKQIHRSQVLEAAENLPPQYQQQLEQIFPMLVERLVDFELLSAVASKAGMAKDEEVRRRMADVEMSIMREVYLERQIDAQITDEALRGRYDAFVAANPPQAEVHARHILLADEAAAKDAIVALDGGADFADLARERSTGPSSADGGDLGYFTKDQMVPEFADAAFAMESGSHSQAPVKTQFGWHVIKVEDRRDTPPPAFEELEGQLREEASRDVVSSVLSELREGAKIEIADPLPLAAEGAQ